MSVDYVPKKLQQKIARSAKERCGYCLVSALITGVDVQVEHLWPTSKGGLTVEDNLWLACSECNQRKADRTLVVDSLTKKPQPSSGVWSRSHRQTTVCHDLPCSLSPRFADRIELAIAQADQYRLAAAVELQLAES